MLVIAPFCPVTSSLPSSPQLMLSGWCGSAASRLSEPSLPTRTIREWPQAANQIVLPSGDATTPFGALSRVLGTVRQPSLAFQASTSPVGRPSAISSSDRKPAPRGIMFVVTRPSPGSAATSLPCASSGRGTQPSHVALGPAPPTSSRNSSIASRPPWFTTRRRALPSSRTATSMPCGEKRAGSGGPPHSLEPTPDTPAWISAPGTGKRTRRSPSLGRSTRSEPPAPAGLPSTMRGNWLTTIHSPPGAAARSSGFWKPHSTSTPSLPSQPCTGSSRAHAGAVSPSSSTLASSRLALRIEPELAAQVADGAIQDPIVPLPFVEVPREAAAAERAPHRARRDHEPDQRGREVEQPGGPVVAAARRQHPRRDLALARPARGVAGQHVVHVVDADRAHALLRVGKHEGGHARHAQHHEAVVVAAIAEAVLREVARTRLAHEQPELLESLEHGLRARHFELHRLLDGEVLQHAVLHHGRVALRADAEAGAGGVELEAHRLGELAAAVGDQRDLAGRAAVLAPGVHHPAVVDGEAVDLVDALPLDLVGLGDEAGQMLRRAERREGPGHGEQHRLLAREELGGVRLLRAVLG